MTTAVRYFLGFAGATLGGLAAAAAPPVIQSFTASDAIIQPEGEVHLSWSIAGAETAWLDPAPGAVAASSGTVVDYPLATTTYTLRATNADGTATASLTVSIPAAIGVSQDGWTVTQAFAQTTTAGPVTNLAVADRILQAPAGDPLLRKPSETAAHVPFIDYALPKAGLFDSEEKLPGGNANNDVAVRCSATLVVNVAGTYRFGVTNAEGGRLLIDRNSDGDFYRDPAVTLHSDASDIYDEGEALIIDNAQHDAAGSTALTELAPGIYRIEYTFFKSAGNMSGEVYVLADDAAELLKPTPQTLPPSTGDLIVSEFLADNESGLKDADGSREDWIEIYNGTASPIDLGNYCLTDEAALPNKWSFPHQMLAAGRFLVVFASGKDRAIAGSELHTNFKLSSSGEALGLYRASGAGGYTLVSGWSDAYPEQYPDRSYGFHGADWKPGFFLTPTPGAVNHGGYEGFTPAVQFSIPGGIQRQPASLALSLDATVPNPADFEIRYTLDGSIPTLTHGLVYAGPFQVAHTTVVRAAAVRAGWRASHIETRTYLFLEDVPAQDTARAAALGFPTGNVNSQVYRYAMDPAVVNATPGAVQQALHGAQTWSIVLDQRYFSNAQTGIYSAGDERGLEVPCSVELINEDGTGRSAFQKDAGLRLRGGSSRVGANPKHGFRLFFNRKYAGALEYPLFHLEGASHFEKLDLRTPQSYSWSYELSPRNTFVREELARTLQGAAGQPYSRCHYLHLYINGIYWGLYDTDERFDEAHGEQYLGGSEANYDVIKNANSAGGYRTEATQGYLDSLPAGTPPRPGDAAWSTTQSAWQVLFNKARSVRDNPASGDAVFYELQGLQPDGKTPLADGRPPLLDVTNLIDYLLVSFYHGSFDGPLSLFGATNNWFAYRNPETNRGFVFGVHDFEHAMGSLRDWKCFDRTGPWSGVGTSTNLYNSLPLSDPLSVFRKQTPWETRSPILSAFRLSNPAILHEDLAFGSLEYRTRFGDEAHRLLFGEGALTDAQVLARLRSLRAQVSRAIRAEQARWGNNINLTEAAWNAEMDALEAWLARGSSPDQPLPAASTQYGRAQTLVTLLRGYMDGGSKPLYPLVDAPLFDLPAGVVAPGALLGMTLPGTSTQPGTIYFTTDGQDPRAAGGAAPTAGATPYTAPVSIHQSTTVKARAWKDGEWSALVERRYVVGAKASAANLVVTEINYHPRAGAPGSASDPEAYEFIEFQNAGASTIDLTGVHFIRGILYTFPQGRLLQPGERLVLAKDPLAFASRYPDAQYPGLSARTVGGYAGALSNSGEQLVIAAEDGSILCNFSYGTAAPWPSAADGTGATLVFTNANPLTSDPNLPANWSAHPADLGKPGSEDLPPPASATFAQWAAAAGVTPSEEDGPDRDGIGNLMEYYLGGDPQRDSTTVLPAISWRFLTVNEVAGYYPTLEFRRRSDALDVAMQVEAAVSLEEPSWEPAGTLVSETPHADGTETLLYALPPAPSLFVRLHLWLIH